MRPDPLPADTMARLRKWGYAPGGYMSDCHKCGKTNMSEEVTIGDCRMIFGDCREVLPTLPMVDAVITDPPYGLGDRMKGGTWGAKPEFKEMVIWDSSSPDIQFLLQLANLSPCAVFWGGNYYGLPPTRCWLTATGWAS